MTLWDYSIRPYPQLKSNFEFLNFSGYYTSRAASQNFKIYGNIELAQYDLPFLSYGKELSFVHSTQWLLCHF